MKTENSGIRSLFDDKYGIWLEDKPFIPGWKDPDKTLLLNTKPRHMDFGQALNALKNGQKVARSGWNGKGMFLFLVPGSTFKVNRAPLNTIYPEGTEVNYHAHIDMKTAQDTIVPWLASQTDVLAEDWTIVA